MTETAHTRHLSAGFVAIIIFKYFKAAVFLLVGVAALRLARLPAMPTVDELARFLRVASENEIVRRLAMVIQEVTRRQVIGFGVVSLLVGAIFGTEASLLACRIWWSTYFTIVLTTLGLPLELYEILRRPASLRNYVLFTINAAILIYLWRRRNEFRFLEAERSVG